MRKRHANRSMITLAVVFVTVTLETASAQNSSTQPQVSGQQPTAPSPAYGIGNTPISENPPISAIDQPGLEPHAAPLSYLQLGAHIIESADSNITGELSSGSGVRSVTRALGSVELQRLWSNYDLALNYVGGAGYYNVAGIGFKQLQQLGVDQRINWKRGQLAVRDSFSYLPEGNFAGGYGSLAAGGQALGGFTGSGLLTNNSFSLLGQVPRIMNLVLADVTESLTPKSSVTASGGYSFVHFTGSNPQVSGIPFFGSAEVMGQVGYDRIVGPHDQVALTYAYQGFDFSTAPLTLVNTSFHTDVIQAMWGHRISGRMDFTVGVGPQLTLIGQSCTFADVLVGNPHCSVDSAGNIVGSIPNQRLTVAGRASLRYRFPRTSLELSFERFTTNGSGVFTGANRNMGRLSVTRPLTRVWSVFADIGYERNSRLQQQQLTLQQLQACTPTSANPNPPPCPTLANTYSYGFAGAGAHRQLGREFRVYASYQYNYVTFDKSFCGGSSACSRISNRQIATIGLDWTPRPMRLD